MAAAGKAVPRGRMALRYALCACPVWTRLHMRYRPALRRHVRLRIRARMAGRWAQPKQYLLIRAFCGHIQPYTPGNAPFAGNAYLFYERYIGMRLPAAHSRRHGRLLCLPAARHSLLWAHARDSQCFTRT
jgi:hypothetical protein